jgi:hypothetical protein
MAKKAERTLVKSPPEVWQLIDDEARVGVWLEELGGIAEEVEAIEREDEEIVVWRAGDMIELGFRIAKKGWGTHVSIDTRGGEDEAAILEDILDELSDTEKRPFSRE